MPLGYSVSDDFKDATLVLLGHGSTKNAESQATVYQHAAELRKRGIFGAVLESFWKQSPQIKEVLAGVTVPRIFLVPLFISEGYFSEEVIPRELGLRTSNAGDFSRVLRRGAQTTFYARPIGTHQRMSAVLLARAKSIVQQFPFPRVPKLEESTLFIAGHGTVQNENSRVAIDRQVDLLREQGVFAAVHGVFLEETPRIEDCYKLSGTRNVIVVPFFMSDGMHSQEDIPVLLGEAKPIVQKRLKAEQPPWRNPTERQGKLVWYASSIGNDPAIADVILDRVRESTGPD